MPQCQMQMGLSQGQAGERLTNMPHLGRNGTEKLAPHGGVVEQMADFDAGAGAAIPGTRLGEDAPVTGNLGAALLVGWARLQRHLGDAADAGQRLAAKTEGADLKK